MVTEFESISVATFRNTLDRNEEQMQTELSWNTTNGICITVEGNEGQTELNLSTGHTTLK